jgi:hypothetical protein
MSEFLKIDIFSKVVALELPPAAWEFHVLCILASTWHGQAF